MKMKEIVLGAALAFGGCAVPQQPEVVYVEKETKCPDTAYVAPALRNRDCFAEKNRDYDICLDERDDRDTNCEYQEAKSKIGLGVESKCILYTEQDSREKKQKCLEAFMADKNAQAKVVERFKPCYEKSQAKFDRCVQRTDSRFDRCQKENEKNYQTQKR